MQTPDNLYAETVARIYAGELMQMDNLLPLTRPVVRMQLLYTLRRACENGNLHIVKRILELGMAFDKDEINIYALGPASLFGHREIVDKLLETGIEVTQFSVSNAQGCEQGKEQQYILKMLMSKYCRQ